MSDENNATRRLIGCGPWLAYLIGQFHPSRRVSRSVQQFTLTFEQQFKFPEVSPATDGFRYNRKMSDDENGVELETYDEDTMKILLATDIHLGYEDRTKRVQENDSFITFEEILQQARELDVDFVLLGGDLFHDSKPSQKTVLQCMELLKKYTMGERNLQVNFLSNPKAVFPQSAQKTVNFEDPNMNIAMPIFSIHGNHDNPSFQITGSMDIFGASGLINYFGKWPDLTNITVPPLIFSKGKTYVSIYGLSYVNDQRLSRLLRDDQLILMRPVGLPEPFKIMVLHQNRSKHTENGYIPENKLPECLDLIFWGHEHECRVEPEHITDHSTDPPRSYHITQPGSSVATSLCQAEAVEKHIGLLQINQRHFRIEPIKLKTVRPFVFEDLHLQTVELEPDISKSPSEIVYDHVDEYIEHILLPKAKKQRTDNPNQPKLPLIRLRIFYTQEEEIFDHLKLARKYNERVANPRDMVVFRKERGSMEDDKKKVLEREEAYDDIRECFSANDDDAWSRTIQGGISKYFARDPKNNLKLLSVNGLNEALKSFVDVRDDDAFKNIVGYQEKKVLEYLKSHDAEDEVEMIEHINAYREMRRQAEENGDEEKEAHQFLTSEAGKGRKKPAQSRAAAAYDDSEPEADEDLDAGEDLPSTRGRGRGSRGRGRNAQEAKPTLGRGRKKPAQSRAVAAHADSDVEEIIDDLDDEKDVRISTADRGRGTRDRGRTARGSKTTVKTSPQETRAKTVAAKSPFDVSKFAPKANSSMLPTGAFSLSQFRSKPATKSQKGIYVDDSDSD